MMRYLIVVFVMSLVIAASVWFLVSPSIDAKELYQESSEFFESVTIKDAHLIPPSQWGAEIRRINPVRIFRHDFGIELWTSGGSSIAGYRGGYFCIMHPDRFEAFRPTLRGLRLTPTTHPRVFAYQYDTD
jgi:hypothetical protein